MSNKFQVEIPLADQVENQTVEDIWNRWVSQGVDPDEEHVVVEVVHEEIVSVIARGNLYECLVAASKVAGAATRFYPAREFDEDAKKLH